MNVTIHHRERDDPRPVLAEQDGDWTVQGWRCTECGYRLGSERPRCPVCHAQLEPAVYGPAGVVWGATVLRAGAPERPGPFGLAYVDLDEGPRILCHFAVGDPAGAIDIPAPGTRVVLAGLTERGDPQVRFS